MRLIIGLFGLFAGLCASTAFAQSEIRIVGSSTVYPFSTMVAQEFRSKTGLSVIVEPLGSGGGHQQFCSGIGPGSPDITNSSRRQTKEEYELCQRNGVTEIIEVKIGYDGIVLASARGGIELDLTLEDVFRAFAEEVPAKGSDCALEPNPNRRWSDINPELPNEPIEAYGPPPTSGTRDAFVEIAMEGGAKQIPCLAALRDTDKSAFERIARTIREDGRIWIDSGENDNAIVQTLVRTPTAVGIFGYSFLDQNFDRVQGVSIDGVAPEFENISSGDYPVSRSLYFYVKRQHVGLTDGLLDYAMEFTSDEAWGPGGYLEEIGLVPLSDEDRAAYRSAVENLEIYAQ